MDNIYVQLDHTCTFIGEVIQPAVVDSQAQPGPRSEVAPSTSGINGHIRCEHQQRGDALQNPYEKLVLMTS